MDAVIVWIRGFLYLLFFATLVQVILPDDGVRKYTRLVVGLIVLAALLQPVTNLVKNPSMLGDSFDSFFGSTHGNGAAESWIAEGERIRALGEERAVQYVSDRAGEQVEGMVQLVQGVASAEVVDIRLSEQGIDKVELRLIGAESAGAEVRAVLRKFFGIPEEAVTLTWHVPEGG